MDNKTKLLLDRTFLFAVNVLKFLKKLPYNHIDRIPILQVARSSASVGANYEESQGAISKKDFTNKISISYREARETHYWLRMLQELNSDPKLNKEFELFISEASA